MSNKMLTFNYTEAKCIVICGDIHGAFEEMVFKLCVQYGMTDTLLIIAGDCGFGFEKPGYYEQIFESLLEARHPITHWCYGHFHQSWSATINGILFSMLDIMEFKELQ